MAKEGCILGTLRWVLGIPQSITVRHGDATPGGMIMGNNSSSLYITAEDNTSGEQHEGVFLGPIPSTKGDKDPWGYAGAILTRLGLLTFALACITGAGAIAYSSFLSPPTPISTPPGESSATPLSSNIPFEPATSTPGSVVPTAIETDSQQPGTMIGPFCERQPPGDGASDNTNQVVTKIRNEHKLFGTIVVDYMGKNGVDQNVSNESNIWVESPGQMSIAESGSPFMICVTGEESSPK